MLSLTSLPNPPCARLPAFVGYGAAKAAISNLTKYLAGELAIKFGEGLRVNAIAPGFFLTEQNRTLMTNPDGSYTPRAESVIAHTPFRRLGTPDELFVQSILDQRRLPNS